MLNLDGLPLVILVHDLNQGSAIGGQDVEPVKWLVATNHELA